MRRAMLGWQPSDSCRLLGRPMRTMPAAIDKLRKPQRSPKLSWAWLASEGRIQGLCEGYSTEMGGGLCSHRHGKAHSSLRRGLVSSDPRKLALGDLGLLPRGLGADGLLALRLGLPLEVVLGEAAVHLHVASGVWFGRLEDAAGLDPVRTRAPEGGGSVYVYSFRP